MLVLGIESSCDETAAALVVDGREVRSSLVASQLDQHELFGGVIPEIAARAHLQVISSLVEKCLQEAGVGFDDIDAIAVTQGPGLIGALLVGVSYAKGLAYSLKKPIVPVNHVHAHLLGALLGTNYESSQLFPSLGAAVSGGHTNFYLMSSPTDVSLVGHTTDDACGESFDKVAKLLGLGYPGGPIIEKTAKLGDASKLPMPKVMHHAKDLMVSYSGLKTHIANIVRNQPDISPEMRADICAAFQEEALGQLVRKLTAACERFPQVKSVIVAGGVSANKVFKEKLEKALPNKTIVFPQLKFCADNAAMIAAQGYYDYLQNKNPQDYMQATWEAYAQYPFEKYAHA